MRRILPVRDLVKRRRAEMKDESDNFGREGQRKVEERWLDRLEIGSSGGRGKEDGTIAFLEIGRGKDEARAASGSGCGKVWGLAAVSLFALVKPEKIFSKPAAGLKTFRN